jgi:hypothetical protein
MPGKLYNLARMTVGGGSAGPGFGTITLGVAVVAADGTKFLTFAQAGAQNDDELTYSVNDPVGASEIGRGTYLVSGTRLTRDTILSSTNGNNPIQISAAAQVAIEPAADDFIRVPILGDARAGIAGVVTVALTDIEVPIDATAGPITVALPNAAAWQAQNPSGLDLTIIDINGQAGSNNITPSLNGADIFQYGGVVPIISAPFGTLRLRPYARGGVVLGWFVKAVNF